MCDQYFRSYRVSPILRGPHRHTGTTATHTARHLPAPTGATEKTKKTVKTVKTKKTKKTKTTKTTKKTRKQLPQAPEPATAK